MITAETYCNQLDNMMKNLAEKQPKLVNRDYPILLHNNACPQTNRTFHQLTIIRFGIRVISYKEKYSIPNRLSKMPFLFM